MSTTRSNTNQATQPQKMARIRVVSALGRFGLSCFGLGRFGQFLGWVISALVGGSFWPIFRVSCFGHGSFRPKSLKTNKV